MDPRRPPDPTADADHGASRSVTDRDRRVARLSTALLVASGCSLPPPRSATASCSSCWTHGQPRAIAIGWMHLPLAWRRQTPARRPGLRRADRRSSPPRAHRRLGVRARAIRRDPSDLACCSPSTRTGLPATPLGAIRSKLPGCPPYSCQGRRLRLTAFFAAACSCPGIRHAIGLRCGSCSACRGGHADWRWTAAAFAWRFTTARGGRVSP